MLFNQTIRKLTVLCLIFSGLLVLLPVPAWSLELQTVFDNTRVVSPARVGFREQRHNPMLKEPIVLTGYLEYLEPGQLRKVIETPYEEAFLVTDDYIEVTQEGKTRRLSLGKSKAIRAMLGGIEAILAGQMDKLDELFRYQLTGDQSEWSLRLEPRSKRVSKHLSSMLVIGGESEMSSIRIDLDQGEWSMMEILKAEPES